MSSRAGTPYYMAPEVLNGNYNLSCDMWSAGCMLYILLCGYPPFYGESDFEIYEMVKKYEFDFDGVEWDDVSSDAKDLILKLIIKEESRITAEEALQHRWVRALTRKKQDKSVLEKLEIENMKRFSQS